MLVEMKPFRKQTKGAFGGPYPHKIIEDLQRKLAHTQLVAMALVAHHKHTPDETEAIVRDYITKAHFAQTAEPQSLTEPNKA